MRNFKLKAAGSEPTAHRKQLHTIDYTLRKTKRKFNRKLLPPPDIYYSREFPGLKIKTTWVKVRCCFHEDSTPSLNINMTDGHFRCFACGAKGCDVVAFHMLKYKKTFVETVTFLEAWDHE